MGSLISKSPGDRLRIPSDVVTIELESSTNLVNWSSAATAVLTNVGSATFFRVKAERAE